VERERLRASANGEPLADVDEGPGDDAAGPLGDDDPALGGMPVQVLQVGQPRAKTAGWTRRSYGA
jgi:hypothetical protein